MSFPSRMNNNSTDWESQRQLACFNVLQAVQRGFKKTGKMYISDGPLMIHVYASEPSTLALLDFACPRSDEHPWTMDSHFRPDDFQGPLQMFWGRSDIIKRLEALAASWGVEVIYE